MFKIIYNLVNRKLPNSFDFFEVCRYFIKFSDIDKALAYRIIGGTLQYLMQMDDSLSIENNIKNTHLNPTSFIFEEPNNLLKQEVREPAFYNAVIAAIAVGCSKMNEISNKIDEDTSVCAAYIKNLITLGIVKKESPYGERSSRKTIYSIEDNMFRFWYCFVPENTSIISRGALIPKPEPRKKSTLWLRTRTLLYLPSANRQMKRLIQVF